MQEETKEEKKKRKHRRTPTEKLREGLRIAHIVLFGLSPLFLLFGFILKDGALKASGFLMFALAFFFLGVVLPQQPEVWVVERLGKWRRNFHKFGWIIPILEGVRFKIRVFRHPISIFLPEKENGQPTVDFINASVPVLNPVMYAVPRADHPEYLRYRVDDWVDWSRDNIEPILLGYLRLLYLEEGIDEGLARDNLLDRVREAGQVFSEKARLARKKLKDLRQEIDAHPERQDILAPLISEYEKALKRFNELRPVYKRLPEELATKLNEAWNIGIGSIPGAFIGDFVLSDAIKQAREAPLKAQKQAEAALYKALEETRMRVEPVVQSVGRLEQVGMSKQDAIREALSLERLETLVQKGAWTAGLSEVVQSLRPLLEKAAPALVRAFLTVKNSPTEES